MPLIDMDVDQLMSYGGRNPRPVDFDEYWDEALAEMHAVDPEVELVPHEMKARYADAFDMYFTGVRGARIHAQLVRPKDPAPSHPGLVAFHGYGGNSGDWVGRLAYVAQGYTVAALDCRGQANRSQDPGRHGSSTIGHILRGIDGKPDELLYREMFLDAAQLARIVMDMPDVDANRVGSIGGSQGGGLALACAALEPRIKRTVAWYPFLCDYLRVWEMDLDILAYAGIREYFRAFDPRHKRRNDIFTRLGYVDVQHLAPRIRANVLMICGLLDNICPPSSQFAAYNKITSPKDVLLYPDFGHESITGADDEAFRFMADL